MQKLEPLVTIARAKVLVDNMKVFELRELHSTSEKFSYLRELPYGFSENACDSILIYLDI